jgi:hypothetical protein
MMRRIARVAAANLCAWGLNGAGIAQVVTHFFVDYGQPSLGVVPEPLGVLRYDAPPRGFPLGLAGARAPRDAALRERLQVVRTLPVHASALRARPDDMPTALETHLYGPLGGPCFAWEFRLPQRIEVGQRLTAPQPQGHRPAPGGGTAYCEPRVGGPVTWLTDDQYLVGAPARRRTLDGSEYEAVPLALIRNGVPWSTSYWGYRLGLTAGSAEWDDANKGRLPNDWPRFPSADDAYELVALPPPFVEGEVVEYVGSTPAPESNGGHYVYAVDIAEQRAFDASPEWRRTGRSFKTGGFLPVCRIEFRSDVRSAPTYFYSASAEECATLAVLPGFAAKGQVFRASLPRPQTPGQAPDDLARCPVATVPVYRVFNRPGVANDPPNHRYVLSRFEGRATGVPMPSTGRPVQTWSEEGIAFCVPE